MVLVALMRTVLAIGSILLSGFAYAFPYSTSFENPPFTPGILNGQDGWINPFASYVVVNGGARTGSQAVQFTDSNGTADPWAWVSLPAGTTNAVASVWVNVSSNSSTDYAFGLDAIYDGGSSDFSRITVNKNGDVFGTQGSSTNSFTSFLGNVGAVADSYVQVSLSVDASANTAMGWVKGVGFALPTLQSAAFIEDIDLFSHNRPGTTGVAGSAMFDDYSVAPIPEPATIVFLTGLAAATVLRKRTSK